MESVDKIVKKNLLGVPEPTIRRLPTYLTYLQSFKDSGKEYVSAPHIAEILGYDPTQVTKDLSYTGIVGKTKVGYEIATLISTLEVYLGYNRTDLAFLIGVGNMGTALLKYEGFKQTGLKIAAAFDLNPEVIGKKINGIEIFHLDKFRNLSERLHVKIAIITTPAAAAQSVTDLMVGWGIKAIWNFAPTILKVPEGIIVENTSIYSHLAVIMSKLQRNNII